MFFDDLRYRIWTSLYAAYKLWTLPKSDVDSFLNSYVLFEADKVTNSNEKNIVDYYRVLNHLCSLGQVEKMYIPPVMTETAGIWENQRLFEVKMMKDLGIDEKVKMNVLDVGCGRGRIASHVARVGKNCQVTGINIDASQIENAREHVAQDPNIAGRVTFINQSYNDPLPFPDQTFDAVYNVQALTYAKDYASLFKELNRVMKPGAKFSCLDWFLYKSFDPKNPEHNDMLQRTKKLIGAVHDPTPEEMCEALKNAGFEVILDKNASIGGYQYPLIDQADKYFNLLQKIVDFLVFIRFFPKHLQTLLHRLTLDGQCFVEGDKLGYWTSVHHIVAVKKQ